MAAAESALARELEQLGGWTTVYTDLSVDTGDPSRTEALRRRAVVDGVRQAGAPEADVAAVEALLAEPTHLPSPTTLFALVREGQVVVQQVVEEAAVRPDVHTYGPVPDLVPLLAHLAHAATYVLVEAERGTASVTLRRLGDAAPEQSETIEGRQEDLTKVRAGGWSEIDYQHRTEEIWKQDETEVAAFVDRLVLDRRPDLVIVSGDVRARELLVDALSKESRAFLTQIDENAGAPGASQQTLAAGVARALAALAESRRASALERLRQFDGEADGRAAVGLGATVSALQQAQVETLLVDSRVLEGRTVLALGEAPWVATGSDALSEGVEKVTVGAAQALLRAALLTDAEVVFADVPVTSDEVLEIGTNPETDPAADPLPPHADGVAAVLRWSSEPSHP
ncbi:Vms1/Ankzf1 family peptidyl-tRNA hydrolase [Cnuibacter physcomitrellae]|uniref:baeRF2 domain-containing protein n=1 Tax=Cnuibacter physcomitrellae TaxID=1619308 RepID=UPI0021757B0F|nr:Vms1/Ankzf1 family peptidyl-tRNA hydrolase [Cnuibacter physcomitrellae]MCS5496022.1 Vms1/Ankzf1 family peptidyl-tRNA hydrolase [Cnuibacter physcomitrellae]